MNSIRVATWNLDGYKKGAALRLPGQIDVLKGLEADVLVLTEVRDTTDLEGLTFWWSDQGAPPYSSSDRSVCVASPWPGRPLKVTDSRLSVCVELEVPPPLSRVIVYGTVIPYKLDGVAQGLATSWQRHAQAVADVRADLNRLRDASATHSARIVVAGDFNMNLDGTVWYGTKATRQALNSGLSRAGLHCHTLEDIRATRGSHRAIVDHLWTSTDLHPAEPLHVWCDRKIPGRLSDHNGVALRLKVAD